MPTTPYMSLMLPTVSVTLGPQYATDNNTAFGVIDSHNHTSGQGVQIPSAGININSDLDCNGFNFTELRSTRYDPQGSPIGDVTDLGCLYVAGVDLYFNDVSGNQIQLTAGGALNAASIGGIGGDYTTSNASVFYTSATQTFSFWQDTNQRAKMDVGPILLRKTTASSAAITLEPDAALASGYTITLPAALPGSTTFLGISNTGAISFGNSFVSLVLSGALSIGTTLGVTGAATFDGAIVSNANFSTSGVVTISGSGAHSVTAAFANAVGTPMTSTGADPIGVAMTSTGADAIGATMTSTGANSIWGDIQRTSGGTSAGPRTYGISSSSGTSSTTSTSFVDSTNLSISFTASGNKVIEVWLISDGAGAGLGALVATGTSSAAPSMVVRALRAATELGSYLLSCNSIASSTTISTPGSILLGIDLPAAGTYTYKVQQRVTGSNITGTLNNLRLYIKEI